MRGAALLLLLCCTAGVAQAAPATDAEVASILDKLGMGGMAVMGDTLLDNRPALKALPEADRQCASEQIQQVLGEGYRRLIIVGLGNDGDTVTAEWLRFLSTPASGVMSSSFARSTPENTAINAVAGLPEHEHAQTVAFLDSPAYSRLTDEMLDTEYDQHDRVVMGAQISEMLQTQCGIALKPEEIF